jgi:hypothetical protein
MTAIQWIKTLEKQYRDFNKSVFTTTELASLSGQSRHFLLVQLSRLVKKGVLIRYKRGLYGEKEQPVEELIPYLDSSAYCTGQYALFKYGLTTQIPTTVTCFTKRHHCRNRIISAGSNTFEFFKPKAAIYSCPESKMAMPEQAFCDYVYYCRNRGLNPSSISTFRKLSSLNKMEVEKICINYPGTVQKEAVQILGRF